MSTNVFEHGQSRVEVFTEFETWGFNALPRSIQQNV
jgi:hypothetical protein